MNSQLHTITERAHLWVQQGRDTELIRWLLFENGLSEQEVTGLIRYWRRERARQVRKQGLIGLAGSLLGMLLGLGLATGFSWQPLPSRIHALGFVLFFIGLGEAVDAVEMLVRGARMPGPVEAI